MAFEAHGGVMPVVGTPIWAPSWASGVTPIERMTQSRVLKARDQGHCLLGSWKCLCSRGSAPTSLRVLGSLTAPVEMSSPQHPHLPAQSGRPVFVPLPWSGEATSHAVGPTQERRAQWKEDSLSHGQGLPGKALYFLLKSRIVRYKARHPA